ncbi:MAG: hypothetical protein WC749_09935 [Dehalococcoidia bacterium]
MKIRTDFVTNSSSTSFVIIATCEFTEDRFLELVGVSAQSPLKPLFAVLYHSLKQNMCPAKDYARDYYHDVTQDWITALRSQFAEEVINRITKAEREGHKVYLGKLSSEENCIESFFCVDSFEIENENIYLNALDCAW